MEVPKITIDTNCVINVFDQASATATSVNDLRALMRYAFESKVQIAVTTRVEADILQDENEKRRSETLNILSVFPVISTVMRFDISRFDQDVLVDNGTAQVVEEIQRILFPGLMPDDPRYTNKVNDVDHIAGHRINQRDIFVTDDKGILRRREHLLGLSIQVMTPKECLEYVDGVVLRSTPRPLSAERAPGYYSRELAGAVTFDYSNNNHRYTIGEAQHLFELVWSKASNTAIHAYSDADSIEAIALAKGVNRIESVRDAAVFDFTSRTRAPGIGQIVIWKNRNGLYAATRILAVADESRGDAADELTFEYKILNLGGRDFS
jgi:hypothetical protein